MGHLMSPSEDIARFFARKEFHQMPLEDIMPEKFFDTYSKFLNNPSFVHCVIFLVLLSLLGGSIWTAVNMEEDFSPEKTFDEHSFLAKSLASLNKIYSDHQIVRIITELPVSVYLFKKNIREIKMFRHACKDFPIWLDIYDSLYQSTAANMDEYLRSKTWHERAYVVNNLRKILPEGYSICDRRSVFMGSRIRYGFHGEYCNGSSYHLYRKRGRNEVEHMKKTLQLISGPSAQAALTTIACVIPLLFHDVYMYVVFAKTVVLCSIFGFLHATFVMPLLFSSVERLFTFISSDNHPISLVSSQIALNLIPSRQRRQNSGEGSQAQPRRPTVDDDYQETTSV
ncbi:unnamed protein product [Thelazia callipaeda]|uniref:Patched domain-containing protein 1 n=1 Tax=Thelazia callipaeda TaxID=103827 RepID=A0A0N5D0T8_THECL|nr:unnamed protein product [Thelazia callipaeda]